MRFILTLLFTFLIYGTSFSQIGAENAISASIQMSSKVLPSIQLITVNSMTFGNTQPGQKEIYVNPISDINAGFMVATGTPGTEFRLEYLQQRTLTNTSGSGSLTFTYEISGNEIEDQSSSELFENANRSIRFNSEGRFYLWIGGRVNLSNARPGNYEGDFTIEIDYI